MSIFSSNVRVSDIASATAPGLSGVWGVVVVFQSGADLVRASRLAHLRGLPLTIWAVAAYSILLLMMLASVLMGHRLARIVRIATALVSGAGLVLALVLLWIETIAVRFACRPCVVGIIAVACVFTLVLVRGLPVATRGRQAAATAAALIVGVCSFPYLLLRGGLPDIQELSQKTLAVGLAGAENHGTGDPRAPLVVEFADFECQACAVQAHSMQSFLEDHPNDVRFVFRHFPLTQRHAQAFQAAEAAECAAQQRRFWEMSRLMYSGQGLESAVLAKYAGELNLDAKEFTSCLSTHVTQNEVERDMAYGRSLGVHATPSFVTGRLMIVGTIDPGKLAEIARRQQGAQQSDATSTGKQGGAGKSADSGSEVEGPCSISAACR